MSKHSSQEYTRKPLGGGVLFKGLLCVIIGLVLVGIGFGNGEVYTTPKKDYAETDKQNIEIANRKKEELTNKLLLNGHKPAEHTATQEAHDKADGVHKAGGEHGEKAAEVKPSTMETRIWANFLIMFLFVSSIGAGSLFLVGLEHLVGAKWSSPIRRITEILSFMIFPAFVLGLIIIFGGGMGVVFDAWMHPNGDPIILGKKAFLNEFVFICSYFAIFGFFAFFYFFFIKNSNAQDTTHDQKYTRSSAKWAPVFVIGFAFAISLLAINWIMTLSPKWFSTMFGVAYFGGTVMAALAASVFATVNMKENNYLHPKMTNDTFYSLAGLMFGFNCFWAYVSFCQFMLIWYSNIPEETFWFLLRWDGQWLNYTLFMIVFHFVIPFALLISRSSKTNLGRLKIMSVWLLIAHHVDLYWQVIPTFSNTPFVGLIEIGFILVGLGLIVVVFAVRAKNVNHVPIGDPKLEIGLGFRLH